MRVYKFFFLAAKITNTLGHTDYYISDNGRVNNHVSADSHTYAAVKIDHKGNIGFIERVLVNHVYQTKQAAKYLSSTGCLLNPAVYGVQI